MMVRGRRCVCDGCGGRGRDGRGGRGRNVM